MSDQKKAFFADLAALLHKHHVEIDIRTPAQEGGAYGMDFDFNSAGGSHGEYECVEVGDFLDVVIARKLAND